MNTSTINYIDKLAFENNFNGLAKAVKNHIDDTGYVVIKNFTTNDTDNEESISDFLSLSEMIGETIPHDTVGKIIWDIKTNLKSNSNIKTYSEHSHEAELHTDSQYSEYPEDYFGLLTLNPAKCGGGISILLSLENIIRELREVDIDGAVENTLRTTDFPFIIPNVFKKTDSEGAEFNFGPMLREGEIRFRVDTFEKAIALRPDFCSSEQKDAFMLLKEVILNSPSTQRFVLERGDLIFINNKTMLHGRTQFEDHTRHLLRIRMNKN